MRTKADPDAQTPNYPSDHRDAAMTDRLADQLRLTQQATDKKHITFCQLPVEIILEATNYLCPADILALRAANSRLRATLKPLYWKNTKAARRMKRYAEKEFAARLNSENFRRCCIVERRVKRNWDRTGEAACSACGRTHPISLFSSTQLNAGPELRCCRGTSDVLRVCQHLVFTFVELKALQTKADRARRATNMLSTYYNHNTLSPPLYYEGPAAAGSALSASGASHHCQSTHGPNHSRRTTFHSWPSLLQNCIPSALSRAPRSPRCCGGWRV